MKPSDGHPSAWWRRSALVLVAIAGIVSLVGSGGGLPDDEVDTASPGVWIDPERQSVQVGTPVTFSTGVVGRPPFTYEWRRNGVAIAGANGPTYTLPAVNLGDDGAEISVRVSNSYGSDSATGVLLVSSLPPAVYQDGDFALSAWTVTAVTDPRLGGPTHAESRVASGGNPDAYRAVSYEMTRGPSSIRVFHTSRDAAYVPTALGAISGIDLTLACQRDGYLPYSENDVRPAFEQGGRWYVSRGCDGGPGWVTLRLAGLRANDFSLIAGPACNAGEACPDFSAGAATLRFGFVSSVRLTLDAAGGPLGQDIDSWKATVWRR